MIEQIIYWDQILFLWLNSWHNEFFDGLMRGISGLVWWFPLYAVLLVYSIKKMGKKVWLLIVGVVLVIVLADQISSSLLKPGFKRPRPCYEQQLQGRVHQVAGCGGPYGFVSSHAANTFALATLLVLILKQKSLQILFLWAGLVAYSRIYLGVHYPLDVFFGGLLGVFCAYITYLFIKTLDSRLQVGYFNKL